MPGAHVRFKRGRGESGLLLQAPVYAGPQYRRLLNLRLCLKRLLGARFTPGLVGAIDGVGTLIELREFPSDELRLIYNVQIYWPEGNCAALYC